MQNRVLHNHQRAANAPTPSFLIPFCLYSPPNPQFDLLGAKEEMNWPTSSSRSPSSLSTAAVSIEAASISNTTSSGHHQVTSEEERRSFKSHHHHRRPHSNSKSHSLQQQQKPFSSSSPSLWTSLLVFFFAILTNHLTGKKNVIFSFSFFTSFSENSVLLLSLIGSSPLFSFLFLFFLTFKEKKQIYSRSQSDFSVKRRQSLRDACLVSL